MRFRTTALPSARGQVKPICGPSGRGSRTQNAAKKGPVNREPSSYTLRKSLERSRRTRFGKPEMETTSRSLRSVSCARVRRPGPERRVRSWSPYGSETHASWRGDGYSVEKYVSACQFKYLVKITARPGGKSRVVGRTPRSAADALVGL